MKTDFFNDLNELALGSRLKRLSDRLLGDAADIYSHLGHDLSPRWFTLIALLDKQGQVGIVEASELLGISQPAISQFSRELIKKGYVIKKEDKNDSRKKQLSLTKKGVGLVAAMQPMWKAVDEAARELCEESGIDFFYSLIKFEQALNNKSLKARTLEKL